MRILCLCKRVLDYQTRLTISGTQVISDNGKFILNPFDEIAVEEAVRLKESGVASELVALSVGSDEQPVRYALSMGCDKGILIKSEETSDPVYVSSVIADYIKNQVFDLVLCGKQAIDTDSGQIPGRIAGLLNWPFVAYASKITCNQNNIIVEKEVDQGIEVVETPLPAIVTVDLRLNTPRFPPLPAVLKAKSKPLEVITTDMLSNPSVTVMSLSIPSKERKRQVVDNVDDFLKILSQALN
ncbi:MAG: electron transfer flavoprotein subunit beta/FixA family protein [Deltaproteobacteria bacterium]|nr:electron transfer flavoprotein subunit beta/FixA family protein [Deltaproteobacteria bacterium]